MSAWQCDGLRHDGLLQRADVRDGPLIAQSLRGTPEAFVEIVRRHEVAIHGYLTRRAGQRAADDLLGEVWVRAFGARDGYDTSHEDARPWLYAVSLLFQARLDVFRNLLAASHLLLDRVENGQSGVLAGELQNLIH